jgi:hypothetical protein
MLRKEADKVTAVDVNHHHAAVAKGDPADSVVRKAAVEQGLGVVDDGGIAGMIRRLCVRASWLMWPSPRYRPSSSA